MIIQDGVKIKLEKDLIQPKNFVMEEVVKKRYPPLPLVNRKYNVFSPAPLQANATAFYRSMMPATVLRDFYHVLDYTSGFNVKQDPQVWLEYVNASEVLMIEREFSQEVIPGIERYVKSRGPVFWDVDDHLHAFKSMGNFYTKTEKQINEFWDDESLSWIEKVVSSCSAVTTTTEPLAEFYRKKTGKKVYCIRNAIDTITTRWDFEFEKMDSRDYIVFGFMGGSTHGSDLDVLKEAIPVILDECPNVKFKFIGYTPLWAFDLFDLGYRKRFLTDFGFTSLDKYTKKMYNIDVGLVPLENNEFNRIGKSDLKYLEYTMAGAATVASKIGQYKEAISNKHNGLLADTVDDWINILIKLAKNPEEIKRLQRNALQDVLDRRSIMVTAREWYFAIINERKKWEASPN